MGKQHAEDAALEAFKIFIKLFFYSLAHKKVFLFLVVAHYKA